MIGRSRMGLGPSVEIGVAYQTRFQTPQVLSGLQELCRCSNMQKTIARLQLGSQVIRDLGRTPTWSSKLTRTETLSGLMIGRSTMDDGRVKRPKRSKHRSLLWGRSPPIIRRRVTMPQASWSCGLASCHLRTELQALPDLQELCLGSQVIRTRSETP